MRVDDPDGHVMYPENRSQQTGIENLTGRVRAFPRRPTVFSFPYLLLSAPIHVCILLPYAMDAYMHDAERNGGGDALFYRRDARQNI